MGPIKRRHGLVGSAGVRMNEAHLAGITPYVVRLAAYYAAMGLGTYRPKGYAGFDRVEVKTALPWTAGATLTESALILAVEFYEREERVRYVEFALTPAGFGGKPIVQLVEDGPADHHSDAK